MKYSKVEQCTRINKRYEVPIFFACVYFQNGNSFSFDYSSPGGDIEFCIYSDYNKCILGKTSFEFQFSKLQNSNLLNTDSIGPYVYNWNGTENGARGLRTHSNYGCNSNGNKNYCTKLIQQNNWKIPKDYPIKF